MAAAASAGPGASGSVRGRFPGRPWVGRSGSRADRARVPFHKAGQGAESSDPAQLQILGLHLNMKRLAGACGRDSDSTEEDFVGFTDKQSARQPLRLSLRSNKGNKYVVLKRCAPAAHSANHESPGTSVKQGGPAVAGAKQDSPTRTSEKQGGPAVAGAKQDSPTRTSEKQGGPTLAGLKQDSPTRSVEKQGGPAVAGAKQDNPARTIVKQGKPAVAKQDSPIRTIAKQGRPVAKQDGPTRAIAKQGRPVAKQDSPIRTIVKQEAPAVAKQDSPSRTIAKQGRHVAKQDSPIRTIAKQERPVAKQDSPLRTIAKQGRPVAKQDSPTMAIVKQVGPAVANVKQDSSTRISAKQGGPALARAKQDSPTRTSAKKGRRAVAGAKQKIPSETKAEQDSPTRTSAKQESPSRTSAEQDSPIRTNAEQERLSVPSAKQGFTPEKVVRVHLTQLDPSLYSLNSSFLLSSRETQSVSTNHSATLSSCLSLPAEKQQQRLDDVTPPKQQNCSTDPPKLNRRQRRKRKRIGHQSNSDTSPSQEKATFLDVSPVAHKEEVASCQDDPAKESNDCPLKDSTSRQRKKRANKSRKSESSESSGGVSNVTSVRKNLDVSSKPSSADTEQPTGEMSSRAGTEVGELGSEAKVNVERVGSLTLKLQRLRDSRLPKVKWKLRAAYRQVSEPEGEDEAAEKGGMLEPEVKEEGQEEKLLMDVDLAADCKLTSALSTGVLPKKEETTDETLRNSKDPTETSAVEGDIVSTNEENCHSDEKPSETTVVSGSMLAVEEELPETVETQMAQGLAPVNELTGPGSDPPALSESPVKRMRTVRRGERAKLTFSWRSERSATRRLLAKVKEAQSKAQPNLQAQSSKAVTTNSSGFIKPAMSLRPSRVIKMPRRFMDDDQPPPATETQAKQALSKPIITMAELEQQVLSDTLLPPSDPRFSLFNEDDHLNLLPPNSPHTDSTLTASSHSSSASSPALQSAPSGPPENARKNILRAPTFCWNSSSISAPESHEPQCSTQALFRLSSPASPDEPLQPSSPPSPPSSPLPSEPPPKPESAKRSPLLRAPQFTPSEAHLKIYEAVSLQDNEASKAPSASTNSQKPKDHSPIAAVAASLPEVLLSPSAQHGDLHSLGRRANHLTLPLFVGTGTENLAAPSNSSEVSLTNPEQMEMLPEPAGTLSLKSDSPSGDLAQNMSLEKPLKIEAMTLRSSHASRALRSKLAVKSRPTSPVELLSHEEGSSFPPNDLALSGTDKKVISLLEKAKIQLSKIDKQKSVDLGADSSKDSVSSQNVENDSRSSGGQGQDSPLQGPRIKHVCRHPAVALGQPRAMIPEDIPRLSALPMCERQAAVPTAAPAEDSSSASEPEPTARVRQRPVRQPPAPPPRRTRPVSRARLRMARCGECKGCNVTDDCGKCVNCKDKTKFGGPNTKKQCCVNRRCERIEARRQQRQSQKGRKMIRHLPPARESPCESDESFQEGARNEDTEASDRLESSQTSQRKSSRRCVRQRPCYDLFPDSDYSDFDPSPSVPRRKPRRESDLLPQDTEEQSKPRKTPQQPLILRARSGPEQDAWWNGSSTKIRSSDGTHRLRVDFKEDCDLQNVWLMGGLSVLTSVPITPTRLCLLCASHGRHEFLYCQVCCEPFHAFCLEEADRPLPVQEDSWCCQRCKFCNVCGRKGKVKKPLLQCELCQTNYHVNCLGPNYPVKPPLSRKGWLCSSCVRCKSCGACPAVDADMELTDGGSLCTDCFSLYNKGNYCPICSRCYEENDYESKMVQCVKCDKWVHSKCEGLSDEGYEILSNLPESVVYTCPPCLGDTGAIWKEAMLSELTAGLHEVLQGLMASKLAAPLLRCAQCETGDTQGKFHRNPCDLESLSQLLEEGHYSSITTFNDHIACIIQNNIECGELEGDGEAVKSLYIKFMEKCFGWFSVQDSKYWEKKPKSVTNGLLPHAVVPPYADHTYAYWREREDSSTSSNGEAPQPAPPQKVKKEVEAEPDAERDTRQCALCLKYGDDEPKDAGRLLYIGQNEWTHINCAIWSAEVFEENDGSLRNVHAAVARGRQMRCEHCSKIGATVGCCLSTCLSNFHFMCARASHCSFQDDKKMYCQKHTSLLDGTVVASDSFDVLRRVYVDFEGITFRRKFLQGLEPENVNMMIGSMKIDSLGMLTDLSVSEGKIYPVGYQCSRLYWSTLDARRRCWYKCRVVEHHPKEGDIPPEGEDGVENQTIVHSPGVLPVREPAFSPPVPETNSVARQPPAEPIPSATAPRSFSGARIKAPNFSPSRRPLGGSSRPLPSPGSPSSSPLSHHILTVSDPEVTPLRRTRRPPVPTQRAPLQSSARLSRDPTSPSPSNTPCPLTRCSSGENETLQLLCDISDMEVVSVDAGMPSGPLQCGAQLVVGTEVPGDESEGGSSSEEEAGEDYYRLTRTVVSHEPFSPLLSTAASGHIEQLDGIHDSTDSEDAAQSHHGPLGSGKVPSHLPSEIVDFVLKSAGSSGTGLPTLQPQISSSTATTSSSTQNGGAAPSLSNGTDCLTYQTPQGPPPLRDPPQLQRVCRPLITVAQNGPFCPPDPPSVSVNKPESKLILLNKATGQMVIKVQSGSADLSGHLPMVQEALKSEPSPITRVPLIRPKIAKKVPVPCFPQTTAAFLPPHPPSSQTPGLGTVFLQTAPSSSQAWAVRVLPMLNLVHGTGQLTLGAPAMMTPTITGIPQTCFVQGIPMNTGLLSMAPTPLQQKPQLQPQLPGQLQLSMIQAAPPKPIQAPPVSIKRPGTIANMANRNKKPKLETADKLEFLDPHKLTESMALNLNFASDTLINTRPKRARIKTPMIKEILDLDCMDEDEQSMDNGLHLDLTVDVKTEDPPLDLAKESPCSETPPDLSPNSEDSIDYFREEKKNLLPRRGSPYLCFEISSEDGFYTLSDSAEGAWKTVVEKVQEARGVGRLRHLSFSGLNGARMLGVQHDAVLFLLEQLIGAERCRGYKFLFHPQEVDEEELVVNPSGCARSQCYARKCTFDMFNFLASQHRTLPEICMYEEEEEEVQLKSTRRATSLDLPMAMRYRHLKRTSKEAVGVYRSAIHGRGLFCKRNIDAGEMVIEYSGIVIRSVLTDKREKYYDSKGIGCYMFRIDDFDVVDATMHGNAARFINHSCEPNCYSRVIHVEGQKHIVIFALRSIYRGEELTYDYKFPIEDASNKLPCNCGAKKCRRFLN
ncbi:histone-lysine N-methyltransferase 2B isoform X2 [Pseudophryne corroboree]|uniref:histone-lysine N-methyltransferase 2B isoform X2 n=1 Tax=Pseudophryne corroboree TaxID=495146 RepID=UPI0030814E81